MKRLMLALGLSALTLVGGHFYNRRWDRAVLFFVALVLWGVAIYVAVVRHTMTIMETTDGTEMAQAIAGYWNWLGIGTVVLWLASLVVTALDARRAAGTAHWTPTGVAAAAGLSLLSAGVMALEAKVAVPSGWYQVPSERSSESADHSSDAPKAFSGYHERNFWHYMPLGRSAGGRGERENPPVGDGYLRGRFTYEGGPAEGVRVTLALDGKYESKEVITDENGIFTIRLPVRAWRVESLLVQGWTHRPSDTDRFLIVRGDEPKLVDGDYNEHYWLERNGVKVEVTARAEAPQLEFTIRKRVAVEWPEPGESRTPTTLADGEVRWRSYPGAARYQLEFTEVQRKGETTSYIPVATRLLPPGVRSFRLAELAAVPGSEQEEYQVSVRAFAADGTFLSESSEPFNGGTFVLTDMQRIVGDSDRAMLRGGFGAEDVEKLQDNKRRIQAIETLLQDGLVDEAEKVLAKIEGPAPPGSKAAVTGYLMARRGRCNEARRLFEQAQAEGGRNCIPERYRAGCE